MLWYVVVKEVFWEKRHSRLALRRTGLQESEVAHWQRVNTTNKARMNKGKWIFMEK